MDRALMVRVFMVLGPVEALVEMAAFTLVLVHGGWYPGAPPPAGYLLQAASGAAFTAVVLGQFANAYACRSSSRPPWKLGWFSNPMLQWAVLAELAGLLVFLFVPAVAGLLGHSPPSALGAALALVAVPAVLGADYLHKILRGRRIRP
jgi:magnesium-transporting ATPase (P-type)